MNFIPPLCPCGSGMVPIAILPGHEAERFADLFDVEREQPVRIWCGQCWPVLERVEAVE